MLLVLKVITWTTATPICSHPGGGCPGLLTFYARGLIGAAGWAVEYGNVQRESSRFPEGAAVAWTREAIHHPLTPLSVIYLFPVFYLKVT